MHKQKMSITSIHIHRNGDKTKWAVYDGITTPPAQQHKTNLIVCPSFLLILPCFHHCLSLKRTGNRIKLPLDEGCVCVIKFLTRPAQQCWPHGQQQYVDTQHWRQPSLFLPRNPLLPVFLKVILQLVTVLKYFRYRNNLTTNHFHYRVICQNFFSD